jgi:hypothetical protein
LLDYIDAFFRIDALSCLTSVALAMEVGNQVISTVGADRVLVSLLDFKSSVAGQNLAGWVRFPHAPATYMVVTKAEKLYISTISYTRPGQNCKHFFVQWSFNEGD